ncbi:MAG: hypothetical protein MJZ24_04055 [Paludibacteraceae bacterium]|nr:hypothetical protein [Candidatus Physcocola equi]MCQ2233902.1 hypothetical protein [Paludibacteraceae bacterium]
MADNYLERRYEQYQAEKADWERSMKYAALLRKKRLLDAQAKKEDNQGKDTNDKK